MAIQGNCSERFGDTPISFGMTRFQNGSQSDDHRWLFQVNRYIRGPLLIEAQLSPSDLRAMSRWLLRAAELVETDGGRTSEKADS